MSQQDALTSPLVPPLGLSARVLAAIFVGGALGTVARYLLDAAFAVSAGHFPWTTLCINLSGSLAIGLLIPWTDSVKDTWPLARPFFVVGLLGGWTTYSTLAVDAVLLGKTQHLGLAAGYLLATLFGGVALVALGATLGRRAVRR